jgi:alkylated DNA repair dioxygenase AlkB
MKENQLSLFHAPAALPDGFSYQADVLSAEDEHELVDQIKGLAFREFELRGFLGKRRIVSFGWQYDFNAQQLRKTADIPAFLRTLGDTAARFAGIAPSALVQVLVTEYAAGAAIGWHKDRPMFGDVVGISLVSPCVFRLRRRAGSGWQRASLTVEPRSAYLLRGPSRSDWEHSIPAVERLRYSVTLRTFRPDARQPREAGSELDDKGPRRSGVYHR